MRRPSRLIPVVFFGFLAPFDCHAQAPAQPPPGDIYESGGARTPPGDLYDSGGCPGVDNDLRHYIKNGTIDRCAWAEAHYVCDPLTKQYGMPVHILIKVNGKTYKDQYERCGGDPCSPDKVVCWGWKDRPNRSQDNQGAKDTPKGLERGPSGGGSPKKDVRNPDNRTLLAEMDKCLRDHSKIVYYSSPNTEAYEGAGLPSRPGDLKTEQIPYWSASKDGVAYDKYNSTIIYKPSYLDAEPTYKRLFSLAPAFADHVQQLEQRTGIYRDPFTWQAFRDVVTGFMTHCYYDGFSPGDPRPAYEQFLRSKHPQWTDAMITTHRQDFDSGFGEYPNGFDRNLTHEPKTSDWPPRKP